MSKGRLATGVSCAVIAAAILLVPAVFADGLDRTYDWIISIETEKMKGYLDQKNSTLKPIVKATVSYKPGAGGATTKFEELFYHNWIALGMRRYKPLSLGNSDQVAIVVTHKQNQSTQEETNAAANAIVRIFVDAYLKGNAVTTVIVPDASLGQIVQNLKQANFYPGNEDAPDQPNFSSLIMHLESSSGASKQTMFYSGVTR